MWQILRRNPRAFGAALLLHLILAAFTLAGVDWLASFDDVRTEPQLVQATIVSAEAVEAKAAARRRAEAGRKAEEEARQRAEAERKTREAAQRQAEAKRRAQEKTRQRAEAERKARETAQRQAEAKRRAQEKTRQRAEAERKARETAQRQAEAKRRAQEKTRQRAEAERKATEAAQQRAEAEARWAREAELLVALDAEQATAGELSLYTNAIRERIRRSWVRQPGMGQDLLCLVEVRLIPGGEVVPAGVRVIRSSGNPAFDRSVVAAVYKASPLPAPSGQLFGQFRNLRLNFKP